MTIKKPQLENNMIPNVSIGLGFNSENLESRGATWRQVEHWFRSSAGIYCRSSRIYIWAHFSAAL